ncbi:ComEA family DNA-binding protein [Endozoicomonas atrinae]|uniref:ComEA family DNA-binding protein n=1 Tax=Endozoicomonas atrinae TaxID=1333660 RepID=UPI000826FD92|nr:helix-hairpin-helix domain-containing protein [Endozoicomonas atrinae]
MSSLKSLSAAILFSTLAVTAHAGESDRLNINEASANDIDKTLVFVSEKTAQRIVDYRNQHGEFSTIHDLAKVEGVSKRLARYNRSRISFE